ncbi:MAG: ribosome-associated translation inhibitor RaiA [Candidatus Cloacimonas sp.]|nr:ribosome-associated translation inhibitor RaiA [Candidatus Cloacimonadota bacterium]
MQITITARRFELTNAIRDYVEQSCERLGKYFDHIINIHVILTLENSRNIVEMSMHASRFNLQSESEEMDMYLALDTAVDKMEAQIKKLKDKVTDHQKKSVMKDPNFFHSNLFETSKERNEKKMVKTKRVQAEIMSVSDAIDALSQKDKPYMIFKNVETDKINVLVKTDADQYRLIEP